MGVFTTQGYRGKLVDALTGKILDTFADEDIKVSTNILELFDLGEIPGTFTQTMTLPGTKVNNAFFEHYYDDMIKKNYTFSAAAFSFFSRDILETASSAAFSHFASAFDGSILN